jgi:copper chaperone CopZ
MANFKRKVLHVDGMTRTGCEHRIEKAVNELKGIKEVKAVYYSAKVYLTFDEDVIEIYEIINVIERTGYRVSSGTVASDKSKSNFALLPANKEVGIMKSLKKILDNFLKKIADQNQKQFGNEKLDCCKLDRPKQNNN